MNTLRLRGWSDPISSRPSSSCIAYKITLPHDHNSKQNILLLMQKLLVLFKVNINGKYKYFLHEAVQCKCSQFASFKHTNTQMQAVTMGQRCLCGMWQGLTGRLRGSFPSAANLSLSASGAGTQRAMGGPHTFSSHTLLLCLTALCDLFTDGSRSWTGMNALYCQVHTMQRGLQ